jgi:hypothetical protein
VARAPVFESEASEMIPTEIEWLNPVLNAIKTVIKKNGFIVEE